MDIPFTEGAKARRLELGRFAAACVEQGLPLAPAYQVALAFDGPGGNQYVETVRRYDAKAGEAA